MKLTAKMSLECEGHEDASELSYVVELPGSPVDENDKDKFVTALSSIVDFQEVMEKLTKRYAVPDDDGARQQQQLLMEAQMEAQKEAQQ